MNETVKVGLNRHERELLLRGLRFVRSDIMLEMVDPTPDTRQVRADQLRDVEALVAQLNGTAPANATAGV